MKTRVAAAWRNRHNRKRLETCVPVGPCRHERSGLLRCGNPPRLPEGTLLRAALEMSLTSGRENCVGIGEFG